MMSCHVITGCVTSTGCSVTHGLHHNPSNRCLQTMSLVPHALTVSRLRVTNASGLSDTPGAERSTGGGSGDTVTYIERIIYI